ncbi:hypothetical protein LY13_001062 [Prauserella aidingensis]|uniref:neutral zinc metallopeptidase n=1 Tax=Prauserella aidingensis TaxID=387890 RepID=UPI0020A2E70F|nr:neutral zinc metallopeptidase [Prauserella aidingensis]MCP2252323.1 hypothetical protein [Prauserella aidingensis]
MSPDDDRAGPTGADHETPARPRARRPNWLPVAIAVVAAMLMVAGVVVVSDLVAGDGDTASDITPAADPNAPDSAATALRDSRARLASVDCDPPELQPGRESARAYYTGVLDCLDRAWRPVLDRMGVEPQPASVDVADVRTTECGELPPADRALGLYCDADHTIHLPYSRLATAAGETHEPAFLATLAHEYGHHIQALTGVFAEAGNAMSDADAAVESEVGRRFELQATCFAGLFLDATRANRGAEAAVQDFADWSGVDSHGGARLQKQWASTGFNGGSVAACDTWSAPAADIGGTGTPDSGSGAPASP